MVGRIDGGDPLSYRRERTVVAVDEDIDLFDERSVPWAISTRVQWHRDTIEVDSLSHGNLDVSLPLVAKEALINAAMRSFAA